MNNCDCKCENVNILFEDNGDNVDVLVEDQSQAVNVNLYDVGAILQTTGGEVYSGTCEYWNNHRTLISKKNAFYIYTDYISRTDPDSGKTVYTPAMKIGDGKAYLIDLPIMATSEVFISKEDVARWNAKWRGFIDPASEENLIFTTN